MGVGRALHSPAMREGQATHSLAMSEGESGQTIQTGMNGAVPHAGTHRPAMGESPAMGAGRAIWSPDRGEGRVSRVQKPIFLGVGESRMKAVPYTKPQFLTRQQPQPWAGVAT